ncbi:hypothetical protein LCGC14_2739130 [marine sediment metagenome]|uniref:Uncharacterized protein n=1 Tax=marine sediment metagenome TaxID=412755 RepID=A0A0F8Z4Z4_9ZZZZ
MEGIRALDLAIGVYKELGYPMYDFLDNYKDSIENEYWYKYNKNNEKINITEQEYKEIEFKKKEKEYNSRTKCSRFEIMDI